jgi:uncharacterized phiE125 gp8 family phage protein
MLYTRTLIGTAKAVPLYALQSFVRIDDPCEIDTLQAMGDTAAAEIEAYADLALITQTITTTTGQWPGQDVALPVGPVAPGTIPTVVVIEADGTTTPVADGFWLETGRWPVLHFTTTPGGRLSITYQAGYGATAADIPPDIAHSITDLAARLWDQRGVDDGAATLPPAASRIMARHRRVSL